MHSKHVLHHSEGPLLSSDRSSSVVICLVLKTDCVSPKKAALSDMVPQVLLPAGWCSEDRSSTLDFSRKLPEEAY